MDHLDSFVEAEETDRRSNHSFFLLIASPFCSGQGAYCVLVCKCVWRFEVSAFCAFCVCVPVFVCEMCITGDREKDTG